MSDYHFSTSVSRDDVVSALIDSEQETPYVFAEYADRTAGTMSRDDFLDMLDGLSEPHKACLAHLCKQIQDRLGAAGDEINITLAKPQAQMLRKMVIDHLEFIQGDGSLPDAADDLLTEMNQQIRQQTAALA